MFFLLNCNLCTREPIFNLKMFSSLRISNRVKCCIISLVCKEDAVKAVIWLGESIYRLSSLHFDCMEG